MKDLDRSKVYDLKPLDKEEIESIYNWLQINDKTWKYIDLDWFNVLIKNNKSFLFSDSRKEWIYSISTLPNANAKELFTDHSPDVSKMVTDPIVQSVVNKYQTRSEVGVKKYNTTLEENADGLEVFLNHLQEELMDATLYIEKLKKQVESLKNRL